jgi:DNA-binding CsgD family transcriptional regulator
MSPADKELPKFYETKEFSKLNKEWKKKLKVAYPEFKDLEEGLKEYWPLVTDKVLRTDKDRIKWTQYAETQQYFQLASSYLHTGNFRNEQHRRCWELHCEGLKNKEIAELLGMNADTVKMRIIAIRRTMLKDTLGSDAPTPYLNIAKDYLSKGRFKSDVHKQCWALRIEGYRYNKIASLLDLTRNQVSRILYGINKIIKNGAL